MLGISPNVLTRAAAIGDKCVRRCTGSGNGLRVIALQEAWAFKVGLLYPIVALVAIVERWMLRRGSSRPTSVDDVLLPKTSHLVELVRANSVPSLVVQLLALLLHIVSCGMCLSPCVRAWDPKVTIAAAGAMRGFPFALGLTSTQTASTKRRAWMDSGLCLLCSLAPDESGFEAFCELGGEGLANKGMLWAVWYGSCTEGADAVCEDVVIINTHLIAEQNARGKRAHAAQLAQLTLLIERHVGACASGAEVYVCGDLNLPADDTALDAFARAARVRRIPFQGTTDYERSAQIDHIFASLNTDTDMFVSVQPVYCSLSDHAIISIERRK